MKKTTKKQTRSTLLLMNAWTNDVKATARNVNPRRSSATDVSAPKSNSSLLTSNANWRMSPKVSGSVYPRSVTLEINVSAIHAQRSIRRFPIASSQRVSKTHRYVQSKLCLFHNYRVGPFDHFLSICVLDHFEFCCFAVSIICLLLVFSAKHQIGLGRTASWGPNHTLQCADTHRRYRHEEDRSGSHLPHGY